MEKIMRNRLNHNFMEWNLTPIPKMKRKNGCPALVFEIISIEWMPIWDFLSQKLRHRKWIEKKYTNLEITVLQQLQLHKY